MTVTTTPWGTSRILLQYGCLEDHAVKVKELVLKPKEKTSLQYHLHRTELIMPLNNGLRIRVGDFIETLNCFDCIRIYRDEIHQLENTSDQNLIILEVQYGAETSEDDIVRIDDPHNRST